MALPPAISHLCPLPVMASRIGRFEPLLLCRAEERAGERRRDKEMAFKHKRSPSLQLSPHSFLAGREGQI